ncbi:MAG: hypothetical protein JSW71_23085 [Gemmatimonadota bacterium]|nr:MAG: hypothetical protein JSW71_23085 [Gemmatimonadota bacterium]
MMRTIVVSMFATLACFSLTSGVQAQDGRGKDRGDEVRVQQSVGFSVTERQVIVEFFATHRQQAEALPPGVAKNLARGKRLPPGIAKRPIPSELQAQLPTRVGVEVSIFGDRIVLLEASGVVIDILEGVFR